ncbi:LysR family glycine cleavage system transcriptional activator [Palleronia aestuarii]|uniref:LysR family glycine cleavage system transcriptional activator n=1 Tax=Palleronia aestuarii TaxID=568105 RepID=A0A2W7NEZ1_9RHOB|nr:LysR family transcriptional regulator [Palleronia aestuarii]PZX18995.1 LysR family glycine cleavage system transcriptional activator [Palleronia aestuarii]
MDWRDVPSLQALRGFEAAARHGSLSAAARELNVTHAAIAQHVRRLEAHFGCALMMREGAGMQVSPEGRALADALAEGFGIVGAAATALLRRHEDRPLRIALTPSLAANWLMPRIGKLWAEHPGLELELIPSPDVVDLRAQNYDMALRYGRGPWTGVVSERILDAAHAVVATPGLIARPITTLSDLAGYDLLTEANNAEDLLWAEQNGLEIDRVSVRSFPTISMALEAVRAGFGLGIVPRVIADADIARGDLEIVYEETNTDLAYHMLTRADRATGPLRTLMSWLRREAKA